MSLHCKGNRSAVLTRSRSGGLQASTGQGAGVDARTGDGLADIQDLQYFIVLLQFDSIEIFK